MNGKRGFKKQFYRPRRPWWYPYCPECKLPMKYQQGKRRDRSGRLKGFYHCQNRPWCRFRVGAHPDRRPLGLPAEVETRHLRIKLHTMLADKFALGASWERSSKWQRDRIYAWLRMHAPKKHVAWMNKEECEQTIAKLRTLV